MANWPASFLVEREPIRRRRSHIQTIVSSQAAALETSSNRRSIWDLPQRHEAWAIKGQICGMSYWLDVIDTTIVYAALVSKRELLSQCDICVDGFTHINLTLAWMWAQIRVGAGADETGLWATEGGEDAISSSNQRLQQVVSLISSSPNLPTADGVLISDIACCCLEAGTESWPAHTDRLNWASC